MFYPDLRVTDHLVNLVAKLSHDIWVLDEVVSYKAQGP